MTTTTRRIHAEGAIDCLSGTMSGTQVIVWNTGETSEVEFTLAVSLRPLGQVAAVATGTIKSGLFEGGVIRQTAAVVSPDVVQCLTPTGVTGATGATTATITDI